MKTVKILVCYHKKSKLLKNDVFVPIHCGRDVALEKCKDKVTNKDLRWLMKNCIGDNTGDNISNLNRYLNEATAIYWAWKNYDKLGNPDYIGLCHYRRVFDFGYNSFSLVNRHVTNDYVSNNVLNNKVIAIKESFIKETKPVFLNLIGQFNKNKYNGEDEFLRYCEKTILTNDIAYSKNMFIMPKKEFFNYCEFIFRYFLSFDKDTFKYAENDFKDRAAAILFEMLTSCYIHKFCSDNLQTVNIKFYYNTPRFFNIFKPFIQFSLIFINKRIFPNLNKRLKNYISILKFNKFH